MWRRRRTGREIWHFENKSRAGIHIGNRGVGIRGDSVFVATPDCHLVSLNIKDGTERWRKTICDMDLYYYASAAPVVVGNHVIAGVSGDDLDVPGYVQSHDADTGDAVARIRRAAKKGDPTTRQTRTWRSTAAATRSLRPTIPSST